MGKNETELTKLMEEYLRRVDAAKAKLEVDSTAKCDIVPSAIATTSESSLSELHLEGRCRNAGCKRKEKADCAHHMCFQCCDAQGIACEGHKASKLRKLEDDRYLEEGIKSLSKQKTSFYHFEDKFMKSGQTVVIWCLRDFLRNKWWSGDTLAQQRAQRERLHRKRRIMGTTESTTNCASNSGKDSNNSNSNSSSNSRRGPKSDAKDLSSKANKRHIKPLPSAVLTRFAKVKESWASVTGKQY